MFLRGTRLCHNKAIPGGEHDGPGLIEAGQLCGKGRSLPPGVAASAGRMIFSCFLYSQGDERRSVNATMLHTFSTLVQ
ncbi:hypothetical protein SDC9_60964 [bioreactor metagenome]|uniref:Uncharacterized protein n=1 Tax=bioreactor metagenome TaxID=1076179 RepID=A0A644XEE7_9ZZZZ